MLYKYGTIERLPILSRFGVSLFSPGHIARSAEIRAMLVFLSLSEPGKDTVNMNYTEGEAPL